MKTLLTMMGLMYAGMASAFSPIPEQAANTVPEPGVLALMGLGVAAAVIARRKRG